MFEVGARSPGVAFQIGAPGPRGDGSDHFADAIRGLHDHLQKAGRAAHKLQRCYDRDVKAVRIIHGLKEATNLESTGPGTSVASRSPMDMSWVSNLGCRATKFPAVGATPILQLRACSGDAAPSDDGVEVTIDDLATPPRLRRGKGYAGSKVQAEKAGSAYPLRGTWTELTENELKKYMPNFEPTVQLQPASNAGTMALSLSRARRNLPNLEATKIAEPCMFDPNAPGRLLWGFPAILFVAYDVLMVPLQAFHEYVDNAGGLWAIELCIAIYWTIDIPVSFRTGFFQGTLLEMRPRNVAMKYIQTWCALDVLLVIMEWIGQFVSLLAHASVMRVTRITRVIRVARLLRLTKIPNVWKLIEDQINSNLLHLIMGVVRTFFFFLIFTHALTCTWYAIGTSSPSGWTTYDEAAKSDDSFVFWYFASSRWVLAQVNGRTDIDENRNMQERLFTCLVAVVFAVVFMSIFVSSITATFLQLSELTAKSSAVRRSINEYLLHHRVSSSLVSTVKRQMVANKGLTTLRDDEEREKLVLAQLPEHLQYDLLYEIRLPVLTWHAFFREFDVAFPRVARHLCMSAVQPVIVHHGQDVFEQGDPCSRMFFVHKGVLMYFQYSGEPKASSANRPEGWSSLGEVPVQSSIVGNFAVTPVYAPPSQRSLTRSNTIFDPRADGSARSEGASTMGLSKFGLASVEAGMGQGLEKNEACSEWKVQPGMWLSEGALWLEWENQGRLVADADCLLLALDSGDLAQTLLAYRDAYAMSAIYARRFMEAHHEQERPSDLVKLGLIFESA